MIRRIAHDTLGSTNAEALSLARAGEQAPFWITAKRQTAGRGRRGSVWVSEEGNLYATFLLREPSSPHRVPELSFVAALAVADSVAAVAPDATLTLKWPNDVLLGGKKIAGLLLEVEGANAALGIGINCRTHPGATAFPSTDITESGTRITPDDMFAALDVAMTTRLDQWNRGEGFASIRTDWLARAAGLGHDIRVRLPDRELSGRFDGIDEQGRLLLMSEGHRETIAAGEVFGLPELVKA